jgi:serine/threonine-protein kinase
MDPNAPANAVAPAGGSPAPGASPPAPKLVPFGKYLLLERVAVGGMAEVWLAKRVQGEGVSELLAIKRILPNLSADAEFIKMFVDEARIAGQLQHPGIVPMHELGRIGQSFYIAMEYVWGRDLLQVLRTVKAAGERISPATAAYVGARLCEALHYAHVKTDKSGKPLELVHRDVSPQNVLISFDGKVKLIDFGIAKATSRTTQTQAGTLKGKVGYMSPEQVRGVPVDARSDLFAVGTLLYEMLTVRPLFARGNNFEAMNRVRDADVPPLGERAPDCPPALAAIVMRALSKEPEKRHATAQDMQRELTVFLAGHASSFERYELATWLRRIYEDEFVREKARLDALDSIGRPAMAPVAKRQANPVTSLEIASVSIFDAADDDDETQVAEQAPLHVPVPREPEGPSEVFFHRDEVVQVGEANPEGHVARPLKAVFRPGKANAVEAFRPPIVGRDEPLPPATPRATLAPPVSSPSAVPPPAAGAAHRAPTVPSMPAATPASAEMHSPSSSLPPGKLGARRPIVVTQPIERRVVASAVARDGTPPLGTAPLEPARPDSARPPRSGGEPEPPGRTTHPHFPVSPSTVEATLSDELALPEEATVAAARHEVTHAIASSGALAVSTTPGGGAAAGSPPAAPPSLRPPAIVRRASIPPPDDDGETFDDGGIREPLVPPTAVSRARIVAVSDLPPELPPPRAPGASSPGRDAAPEEPTAVARPGTVPLVGAGDTPSTSAITRALEQMAREKTSPGRASSPGPEPLEPRISGFELDPQQLDSAIIQQILPPSSGADAAPRRGEPTEGFSVLPKGARVTHLPTLVPRATTGDYVFFAIVALLMIALGGTATVAVLHADASAALEVRCVPEVTATVLVDGAPRGRAPVRIEGLGPGPHAVTVVAPGYEEAHRTVVVAAREAASIEVALRESTRATPDAVPDGASVPPPSPEAP